MADYGVDVSGATDLSPTLVNISGDPMMQQVVCRRLFTPNGTLLSNPAARTTDLRRYIGSTQPRDARLLQTIRADATAAILDDERILSVIIDIDWQPDDHFMILNISCQGANGPFRLTLRVDSVTVQVLQ